MIIIWIWLNIWDNRNILEGSSKEKYNENQIECMAIQICVSWPSVGSSDVAHASCYSEDLILLFFVYQCQSSWFLFNRNCVTGSLKLSSLERPFNKAFLIARVLKLLLSLTWYGRYREGHSINLMSRTLSW